MLVHFGMEGNESSGIQNVVLIKKKKKIFARKISFHIFL